MRDDQLPPAVRIHPNIRQAVTVFVWLTLVRALFVIRASDDGCIVMHSNLQIRHLGNMDMHGRVSVVGDVSRFAE